MTRLEELKRERKIINSFPCLSFQVIDECNKWYDHEIACIEKHGTQNTELSADIVALIEKGV